MVTQLQGVSFDWKRKEFPEMHFGDGQQIGFVAQDVEKVLPQIVSTDNEGYKNVSYGKRDSRADRSGQRTQSRQRQPSGKNQTPNRAPQRIGSEATLAGC